MVMELPYSWNTQRSSRGWKRDIKNNSKGVQSPSDGGASMTILMVPLEEALAEALAVVNEVLVQVKG
jgi:hypothetical protein